MTYSPGWKRVYLAMAGKGFGERDSVQKAGVDLATLKRERRRDAVFDGECEAIKEKFSGRVRTLRW